MKKRALLALAILAGLMLGYAPGLRAADLVMVETPKGKKQVTGDIQEETYKYIKIKSRGDVGKLYTAPKYAEKESQKKLIVSKVTRRPKPPKYAKAWGMWKNRKYDEAYKQFGKAGSEVKGKFQWIGAYIWYYAAQSAFKEAKYAQVTKAGKRKWYSRAADKFGRLLKAMPDHYFVPDAAVGLARAQIRLDKFSEAQGTIDDILNSDYPESIKRKARVWEGRLMMERGMYDQAIQALETLSDQYMEKVPELAYLAMISEAYAWQGKDNYRKAENLFRTVGLQSPDDEMRAEAYNSRGLSLMKRGQIREALFSFLRVVVLHRDIKHEYQKALYYAAVTAKEYYSDAPQRAKELAKRLKNRYPGSYWTKKLKKNHPGLVG